MALTRTGIMTAIENSSDTSELNNLNLQLAAVEKDMSNLSRGISQAVQIVQQITNMDSPVQGILDVKTAMEAQVVSYQAELAAYSA